MRIGELSQRTAVPTKTIRYYEQIGVLPPADRDPNGYRRYDSGTAEQLEFIKDAQATGFTLDEIGTVLRLRSEGESTCEHVLDLLEQHLAHLDARIKALRTTRERLVGIVERARTLDPAECDDPNRCQTISPGRRELPAVTVGGELHGAPGSRVHG